MRWPLFRRQREPEPGTPTDRLERDRLRMVAEQIEARGISDAELLRAFRTVERHAFVDSDAPYGDHALPVGAGQTISQPYVVAVMTDLARPPGGWAGAPVLEVGTGSGYQAALLAEMGARVTSIERHAELAEGARRRLAGRRIRRSGGGRGRRRHAGLAGACAVSVHPGHRRRPFRAQDVAGAARSRWRTPGDPSRQPPAPAPHGRGAVGRGLPHDRATRPSCSSR